MKSPQKIILLLFGVLFFLVPLILWPYTSELFEFNKMILVYILTTLILATWLIRIILSRKFIFRRTILDIPLLIFLGSQFISTLLSIDPLTSWFGYYSRFNGGLLSIISYLLLYWAFVSNVDKPGAKKIINTTLWSAVFVSIYGVLERLGIDKDVWQQDVQSRVFSTLGQPNWLAAWLVTLIPITWAKGLHKSDFKLNFNSLVPYFLTSLFFTVLVFTGSRSGLLGFCLAEIVFWGAIFLKSRFTHIRKFFVFNILILAIAGVFGTQYTPSIFKIIDSKKVDQVTAAPQATGTALETGGTESTTIRKIVWQGALEIWEKYPIFGTGVETFAYSYYSSRPIAHNLTTEWDFIYNKAHNEYLNFMANSGTVGILAYLAMIGFSIYLIVKNSLRKNDNDQAETWPTMPIAFLAGYVSILATNFFGFSVVPVQIIFYLYPAFSVVLAGTDSKDEKEPSPNSNQKILNWIVASGAAVIVFFICRYWYADYLYATGSNYNKVNRQDLAVNYIFDAAKLEPNQSIYYGELARTYTNLALAYNEARQATAASQLTEAAIENSVKAVNLSPANVNMKRIEFGVFVMLSAIDPNYLLNARDVLLVAIKQAPTDAKLFYNLGLIYSRIGENDLALQTLKKTVDLKSNYKEARLAYAILLIDAEKKPEAKNELEYILTNIDPTDSLSKQYLESIR
ncbi:MAG: hypothetical protein UU39_C0017G0010 [Candidatus Woesebacteria bacterium GW2011_GWD1_41_12]|uniref:O-antigen ligase-related domain-containing protein n=1 Tax=Candidatus Woesebacteria bacterium GW2011_GWD1_41_12 TaxID=1618593 RepID=A0A0G0URU4_9BACT|nr:MAG: hypothetical protein UU39_C0017G0010 [Candidatus Woesebacteria bacterium GW2011_GWD1_41_12]